MILIIISFILDSVISNVVSINSYFLPLFTLVSFSLVYPKYKKNNIKFLMLVFIFGLLYDICFSSSLYINTLSFLAVASIIIVLYHYINMNIFSFTLINVLVIALYRIISYIIYILVSYKIFNAQILLISIVQSIILNILYGIIVYLIYNYIVKKINRSTYKYRKI